MTPRPLGWRLRGVRALELEAQAETELALILLGGDTVRDFLIVMLIGLISGTYSSIFVASQLLVSWEEGDFSGLLPWRGREPEEQPA